MVEPQIQEGKKQNVAIIGAGGAGLVTIAELRKHGHNVTCFESESLIGGTWNYETSSRTSVYKNLRTNLPRELMAFTQFKMRPESDPVNGSFTGDDRRFPSHFEITGWLKAFAENRGLNDAIRFSTLVTKCVKSDGLWHVTSEKDGKESVDTFDVVCVSNGHYEAMCKPELKGQDVFPGKIEHSHDYKLPTNYSGQRVLLLGASFSGEDISRDMSSEIAQGYLVARKPGASCPDKNPIGAKKNVERICGTIDELKEDGSILLTNGQVLENIDTVMLCTGYAFNYPFLNEVEGLKWDKFQVGPLYQHMFFAHDPSLIFIGVPTLIAHFPFVELQALWVAQHLHGGFEKALLPDKEGMLANWDAWCQSRKDANVPACHFQAFIMYQWPFCNMMRDLTGTPRLEPPCWRQALWSKALGTLAVECEFRNADIDKTAIELVSEELDQLI